MVVGGAGAKLEKFSSTTRTRQAWKRDRPRPSALLSWCSRTTMRRKPRAHYFGARGGVHRLAPSWRCGWGTGACGGVCGGLHGPLRCPSQDTVSGLDTCSHVFCTHPPPSRQAPPACARHGTPCVSTANVPARRTALPSVARWAVALRSRADLHNHGPRRGLAATRTRTAAGPRGCCHTGRHTDPRLIHHVQLLQRQLPGRVHCVRHRLSDRVVRSWRRHSSGCHSVCPTARHLYSRGASPGSYTSDSCCLYCATICLCGPPARHTHTHTAVRHPCRLTCCPQPQILHTFGLERLHTLTWVTAVYYAIRFFLVRRNQRGTSSVKPETGAVEITWEVLMRLALQPHLVVSTDVVARVSDMEKPAQPVPCSETFGLPRALSPRTPRAVKSPPALAECDMDDSQTSTCALTVDISKARRGSTRSPRLAPLARDDVTLPVLAVHRHDSGDSGTTTTSGASASTLLDKFGAERVARSVAGQDESPAPPPMTRSSSRSRPAWVVARAVRQSNRERALERAGSSGSKS